MHVSTRWPTRNTVPIKRVVGVTNGNGTLQHAAELVNKGLLSPKAKLRMPAFDVDLEGAQGVPPELDFILFNGVQIGSLSGSNNTWKLNEFAVDINQVRFGTRNENGEPTPGNNEITILIDQGSGSDVNWCTAIDWVEITFKAMSPIILVHGNGQKGDFYDKTGFTDFLKSEKLLYDNSIQLPKSPIVLNANRIDQQLQTIVKSFGVDSIHMVAHSKGGPDSRGYLQAFQPFRNSEYKVLSLNTLSSPHDGTILVDLLEQREAAAAMVGKLGRIEYLNFPDYTRQMVALTGLDNGLRSLSTRRMAVFNSDNVAALPPDMAITTVGADADLNLNNQIDRNPDEYGGMRQFNSFLGISDNISSVPGRFAMNSIYQILRNTSRISMECCRTVGLLRRRVATITGTPSGIIIPKRHPGNRRQCHRSRMTFNFSGSDIGNHGVSGAYTVKSIVLFGAGHSLIVDKLLDTQTFSFKEFENSDNLVVGTVTIQETSGDGDGFVEPGENGSLSVQLKNIGGNSLSGINATLSTLAPGVTITSAQSTYPTVASSGTVTNTTPFTFTLANEVPCGEILSFKLTVNHTGDGGIPSIINFSVQPGQPTTTSTFNYTGAPVAIPDEDPVGVTIPITVSNFSGRLKDLNFKFGGSSCSATAGSTTVGLDHSFVGDLVIKLTSPSGTTVTLLNEPGLGGASSGNNFCNTLFDDENASLAIQDILSIHEPHSETFSAAEPLAAFRGEDPNGTWVLHVSDLVAQDTGNVRQFSLQLQGLVCETPPKVLFRTNRDGNYEVYVMKDDGTGLVNLTSDSAVDISGQWQPRP